MWSTGSKSLMRTFPPLAGIECITILADHDKNGTGCEAAVACASAWRQARKEARIFMWDKIGDLNDALGKLRDEH
jgi:hypothetical protein